MSSWLFKTAIQHIISSLPRTEWWNGLFQRYVTGGLRLQPYGEFQAKLRASYRHFNNYQAWSRHPCENFSVVEIGTGWFPIIPIGLYLSGAGEIRTYDIVRLIQADAFKKVIEHFRLFIATGELFTILPSARHDRVSELMRLAPEAARLSPVEFLECLNIHAVLGNVTALPLPTGSVDLVFSHGVLEHFPLPLLTCAMAEFHRVCSSSSVMSHFIGMADQFGFGDKSITVFNNLRYSSRAWRWLDSPIIPQNRLRVPDYSNAYINSGFEIVFREDINGAHTDLATVEIAPEFLRYSKEELLVLYSWLIGRPVETMGSLEAKKSLMVH